MNLRYNVIYYSLEIYQTIRTVQSDLRSFELVKKSIIYKVYKNKKRLVKTRNDCGKILP